MRYAEVYCAQGCGRTEAQHGADRRCGTDPRRFWTPVVRPACSCGRSGPSWSMGHRWTCAWFRHVMKDFF